MTALSAHPADPIGGADQIPASPEHDLPHLLHGTDRAALCRESLQHHSGSLSASEAKWRSLPLSASGRAAICI